MMKKLLVLVVMLAMIVSANAMTLTLNVNGVAANALPIVATPGQIFNVSVASSGFAQGDAIYWALVAVPAVGTVSGGVVTAAAPDASGMLAIADVLPGAAGVAGNVDTFSNTSAGDKPAGIYFDGISFAFAGAGKLQLMSSDGETGTVLSEQAFTVVPEPITVALLGLGGLFIRRKIA